MSYLKSFINNTNSIINRVETEQTNNIIKTVDSIEASVRNGNNIYIFGASHAGILSEEVFYRAGGFALFNPIMPSGLLLNNRPITSTSDLERLEGYGQLIGKMVGFSAGDVLICHSVSGRNAVSIDLALDAKSKGATVIALTNVQSSVASKSRHSSGKLLLEVADIVIDNCGDIGDASVSIPNLDQRVSATSTIIGALILNGIVAELAARFNEEDKVAPFFYSANIEGGDRHNKRIFSEYASQIHYQ